MALPQRDFWLLPLISLGTVFLLLAGSEVATRLAWPEQVVNRCRTPDAALGYRFAPNCSSVTKTAEGPWVTNAYNACGYRSAEPCTAVPGGTRRIAIIGSSLSEGYMVEYPNTAAARLAQDLTAMCRAPVQVQNLGGMGYAGRLLDIRLREALALRPDAVVFMTNPFDLEFQPDDSTPVGGTVAPLQPPPAPDSLQHRIFSALKESRALLVAQHFLFRNPSLYVPLYLRYGDKADFLRPPFTPAWRKRLRLFDELVARLSDMAHQTGTPLMIAFVPQEAEVARDGVSPRPAGIDPHALPAALAAIAARHGDGFSDASAQLQRLPHPERLFYQVDGHLSGLGQPSVAKAIAEALAAMPQGPFSACLHAQTASLPQQP